MNNEIKDGIDSLILEIKKSDIYKKYIDIEDKVNICDDIKKLVNEIKLIEKALVKTPSINLEIELKEKEEALNNIPLYLDYKEQLEELNNMLLIVKNKLDKFVSELVLDGYE